MVGRETGPDGSTVILNEGGRMALFYMPYSQEHVGGLPWHGALFDRRGEDDGDYGNSAVRIDFVRKMFCCGTGGRRRHPKRTF